MPASRTDLQIASLAAGFTLGFGFLTIWQAIKQTRQNKCPSRSIFIYMIWGEILSNVILGVLGYLFLIDILKPTIYILVLLLVVWVFEVQLLMQIIINRIYIIAENQSTVRLVKWGTAAVITLVNIAVFCIWIPAHMNPPLNPTYVVINKYWDRASKIIICIIDAALNLYFLNAVRRRLIKHHGLIKYKPLVKFNSRLMIVSIAMDVMIIALMSLPNQVVYIQFHPVAYMVKLNIEMTMANLITRLAKSGTNYDSASMYSSTFGGTARTGVSMYPGRPAHTRTNSMMTLANDQLDPTPLPAKSFRKQGIQRRKGSDASDMLPFVYRKGSMASRTSIFKEEDFSWAPEPRP